MTRADLARAAGVSKAAVTAWFNRDPMPEIKADNLFAVAKLCGVRPEWLMDGVEPMRPADHAASPPTLYGLEGVTPEAAELGREWAKLEEPLRSVLRDVILMAVASQKRERAASGKKARRAPTATEARP